jgi:hypothetical protein
MDPHFAAAFIASQTLIEIQELLPDTDLGLEMKNIISIQYSLFCNLLEGTHYGTENIRDFIEYAEEFRHEVRRLKETI